MPLNLVLCFSSAMKKFLICIFLFNWNAMAAYSLYIEREKEISTSEWLDVCENDESLIVQHKLAVENPETGELIEFEIPNSCVWTSSNLKEKLYFIYSGGSISFSYNEAAVTKAKEIATLLRPR